MFPFDRNDKLLNALFLTFFSTSDVSKNQYPFEMSDILYDTFHKQVILMVLAAFRSRK